MSAHLRQIKTHILNLLQIDYIHLKMLHTVQIGQADALNLSWKYFSMYSLKG